MDEMKIKISNCNNIKNGEVSISPGKLNIKYGINGTGKSTLSTALELISQGKSLDILRPFDALEETIPVIEGGEQFSKVSVFNENFVNDVVFKEDEVIENAFEVFIRTQDFDEKQRELNEKLKTLTIDINSEDIVVNLKAKLDQIRGKFEFNKGNKSIKKNTNYKTIIKKENIFNIPKGLEKFTPFFSDNSICINWVDWKTKGKSFSDKEICPYCGENLSANFDQESILFSEAFKKTEVTNLSKILNDFENLNDYVPTEKLDILTSCIKEQKDEKTINVILYSFLTEYFYIEDKLNTITNFNQKIYDPNSPKQLDKILSDMKIEKSVFHYLGSESFFEVVDYINEKINELIQITVDIKIAIGKLQSVLTKTISSSIKDINDFLDSAGISYHLSIELNSSGEARAVLKYITGEEQYNVSQIRKHLSWGEKNAFSLILFMFYSISIGADLIVLDDPISSFDINKKYAIMHRMFSKQTGLYPRSLYNKTVLMLTHDFEPIIDFGIIKKMPSDTIDIKYIKNNKGVLEEKSVDLENDIKSVIEELKTHIEDTDLCMIHRVAFLRKYIEHEGIDEFEEAYDVLSSLIHGRATCKYKDGTLMPEDIVAKGIQDIQKWITDFDYDYLITNIYNEEAIAQLYFNESNNYLKLQLFRALFEICPSKEIKENDALLKFIHESYHIENDYAYYLDMIKFETVPEFIIDTINSYMIKTYNS